MFDGADAVEETKVLALQTEKLEHVQRITAAEVENVNEERERTTAKESQVAQV